MNSGKKQQLYFKSWVSDAPKAHLFLVHGLGEHCQRYEPLAHFLNQHGHALYSMDLPSHGKSTGERGHIDSFDVFFDAIDQLISHSGVDPQTNPCFLLGHSMGGLIATRYLQTHKHHFNGAVLSAAALKTPQETPAWQASLIRTLSRFFPTLPILALDASGISRDPDVVANYQADPLVNKKKLSARFLTELDAQMTLALQQANTLSLPMLILHGDADAMTAPKGSEQLFSTIESQDKTLKIYPGLYHEIFNEPEAQNVFMDVKHWLDNQMNASA